MYLLLLAFAGLCAHYSQATTVVSATQCSWTVRQREVQLASALLMCDSTREHTDAAPNVHTQTQHLTCTLWHCLCTYSLYTFVPNYSP